MSITAEWTNKDALTPSETTSQSKAVLVIDMPNSCVECPCFHEYYCPRLGRALGVWSSYTGKPVACPLKPLPKKQNMDEEKSSLEYIYEAETLDEFQSRGASYLYGHIDGWNACIEEIEE